MPYCNKCNQEISDKVWKLHAFFCPGKTTVKAETIAVKPLEDTRQTVITPTEPLVNDNSPKSIPPVGAPTDKAVVDEPSATEHPAESTIGSNGSEVFYPKVDPYFVISDEAREIFRSSNEQSKIHPTNILITGQAGGGKTSVCLQFAAVYKRPAVVADFGVLQEPQQLFQTTRLTQNEDGHVVTNTQESGFIRGIETENCVVVMDEMTRVENERVLNPLMPILDGRAEAWIDDLRRRIRVAPGVIFIATINEGSMFAGISSLDAALRDRFVEIYMDYMPPEQEAMVIIKKTKVPELIATTLADFANIVRHTPGVLKKVSTRQLLHAAELNYNGTPLWLAVSSALGSYNDETWRQQCLEIFSLNIKDENELSKWQNKPRENKYGLYQ